MKVVREAGTASSSDVSEIEGAVPVKAARPSDIAVIAVVDRAWDALTVGKLSSVKSVAILALCAGTRILSCAIRDQRREHAIRPAGRQSAFLIGVVAARAFTGKRATAFITRRVAKC